MNAGFQIATAALLSPGSGCGGATIFLLQLPCYFLALAVAGYRLTYNNSKWIVIASNLTKRINSQCEGAKA